MIADAETLEARRVFFASKAYYLGNPYEAEHFSKFRFRPLFRYDTITALCFKDLVTYPPLYTKEEIDQICSDPTDSLGHLMTRQQLEAMTFKHLNTTCHLDSLANLDSLKRVCLCMHVGEELQYISFLYGLTSFRKGLVEFVSASQWLIRPQHAGDVWRIQYSCFCYADYGRGKNDEDIPYAVRDIEQEITDIDSRAPGLKDGDERYVEVKIQRVARDPSLVSKGQDTHSMQHEAHSIAITDSSLPFPLSGDIDDTDSESDSSRIYRILSDEEDQDTQPVGQQEQINGSVSADTLDGDDGDVVFRTEPIQTDQTLAPRLPTTKDTRGHQLEENVNEEEEPTLPGPASGSIFVTHSEAESNQINDSLFSGPFPAELHNGPTEISNDPKIVRQRNLLDANDDNSDRRAHTDTKAIDQAPQVADLHIDETEADQRQEDPKDTTKGGVRLTSIEYLSSKTKAPLLEVADTPNPYTEEEMESYYNWQSSVDTLGRETIQKDLHQEENPSSRSTKSQQPQVMDPPLATRKANAEAKSPSLISRHQSGLPSKSVQTVAISLFFLLLVILALPPEWLSNAPRDRKGGSQQ